MAGKQKGRDDNRYLWPEFSRLVAEIKPRWVVAENVPGIIKIAADDVCSDLERLGYSVGIWNFEAAAVGAPHRRARIFFVGYSEHNGLSAAKVYGGIEAASRNNEKGQEETGEFKRTGEPGDCANMANAGRGLRERGAIRRNIQEENGGGMASHSERPSSAYVPNADDTGNRTLERGNNRELQKADQEWKEQPQLRACGYSQTVSDAESYRRESRRPESAGQQGESESFGSGGRKPQSSLGGMAYGLAHWLDGDYWKTEPDITRTARDIPNRAARLKALGNAVVPAQAYLVFRAITEAENYI